MSDRGGYVCTVCIANYNGEDYLEQCIDSVLKQSLDAPVEIIIHDDCSTDGSVELIERKYPNLVLLKSNKNVGFCVSNNRMVDQAKGEYVLLLNNDASLNENALECLYTESKKMRNAIYGLPQFCANTGDLIDKGSKLDPFLNPIPNLLDNFSNAGMIIGACLWLPRTLWYEVGGFPEKFESLAEDMYVSCVARLYGYKVACLDKSGFTHWVGRNFGGGKVDDNNRLSTTFRRRKMSERNKTFVMIITYPSIALSLILPIHLFLLVVEGILLTLVKGDRKCWTQIYWNCFREVWVNRRYLMYKRRKTQQGRNVSIRHFFSGFTFLPHKLRMLVRHGLPELK